MRYSEIFNISSDVLEAKGVFNADVEEDADIVERAKKQIDEYSKKVEELSKRFLF